MTRWRVCRQPCIELSLKPEILFSKCLLDGEAYTAAQQQTFINFTNLLKVGESAIPKILIKELLVSAGYPEPKKEITDRPLDNGAYFGSAPLRGQPGSFNMLGEMTSLMDVRR